MISWSTCTRRKDITARRRECPPDTVHFLIPWVKGLASLSQSAVALIRARVLIGFLLTGIAIGSAAGQEHVGATANKSAGTTAAPDQRVVLKVGSQQLTQADFEAIWATLQEQQGPADITRRTFGDNYAALLVLVQQALANHLENTPDVQRQLALDRNQILSNAEFARLKKETTPTPQEISAYYSAHGADFDTAEIRRLFVWVKGGEMKDGMDPQEAKALVAAVRQAFAAGGDAAKLIEGNKNVVLDPSPIAFQRGELPLPMNEAAFSLKEGEWSEVQNGRPDALVLVYVVKRGRRDLKEVSAQIAKKVQNQKLQAALDSLKEKTGVWLDEQYFGPPTQKPEDSTASAQTKTGMREEKD